MYIIILSTLIFQGRIFYIFSIFHLDPLEKVLIIYMKKAKMKVDRKIHYFQLHQKGLSRNAAVAKLNIDPIDLEAEREGTAIGKSNKVRVKRASKRSKVKLVNSKVLDKAFFEHYGYSDYISGDNQK